MGIVSNCCVHANNNDEDKDQNNQAKADLQKVIDAGAFLHKDDNTSNSKVVRKFNAVNYKPYIGITNYRNSNFINVNLQILSRLTYFKDFVNIMGKTAKSSSLIQNFIKIMNNLAQGISLDSCYTEFIDEILSKHNFTEQQPINFHLFFLEKLCQSVYGGDLMFNDYKLGDDEITNKFVENVKTNFTGEFTVNDIKLKFFTGFLNLIGKYCKNVKCNYKNQELYSTVLPFIEIKYSLNEVAENKEAPTLQEKINSVYFDKQHEGKCDKCGKVHNKYLVNNKIFINHPKYLIIKVNNKDNIPLEWVYLKNKQIIFFSRNYELFSVISEVKTPGSNDMAAIPEFSCTIKIDYKWINFNDDMITVIDEDNLFQNCYMLYYQLR